MGLIALLLSLCSEAGLQVPKAFPLLMLSLHSGNTVWTLPPHTASLCSSELMIEDMICSTAWSASHFPLKRSTDI